MLQKFSKYSNFIFSEKPAYENSELLQTVGRNVGESCSGSRKFI